MRLLRVVLVCLFLLALVATGVSSQRRGRGGRRGGRRGDGGAGQRRLPRQCTIPRWPRQLSGTDNPLVTNEGKVVLVALMKGYCGYCVNQATRLETLKNDLSADGLPDIEMVLVNGGENISRENIRNLETATTSLPVIQDTENHILYQRVFGGNKDDFIVYDRCGQRAFYIPHPYSYLGNTITERVLRHVYAGRHQCHCSRDNAANTVAQVEGMQGDQPMGGPYRVHMGQGNRRMRNSGRGGMRARDGEAQGLQSTDEEGEDLECPQGDSVCARYVRALNAGTLMRSGHRRRNWHRQHSSHRHGPSWMSRQNRQGLNRMRSGNNWYHRRRSQGHVFWRRGRNGNNGRHSHGGAM